MPMAVQEVVEYVQRTFPDVTDDFNWGERALFYNPGKRLPKGVYFLTFKERDGASDRASRIGPGEFRLNLGVSRQAFITLFGRIPPRPAAGQVVETGHDFTQEDVITPHPVYGWMAWIAVKNPGEATFERLKPLLAESYQAAVVKFSKRAKRT